MCVSRAIRGSLGRGALDPAENSLDWWSVSPGMAWGQQAAVWRRGVAGGGRMVKKNPHRDAPRNKRKPLHRIFQSEFGSDNLASRIFWSKVTGYSQFQKKSCVQNIEVLR